MVKKLTTLALMMIVHVHAYAQAVFNLVNNVSDLNPERDALTITQGTMRISFVPNNGAPIDLTTAFTPIIMRVVHRTDGYTNPVVGSFEVSTNSTLVRWNFNFPNSGPYRLQADVVFADDTYPIFDRYLTVLPTPSAATVNLTVTNITTINYYGGSVTNL